MVLLSIQPRGFSRAPLSVCVLDHGLHGRVTLAREEDRVYLRLKLDLFWAHTRGIKQFGVFSGELFTNCSSGADFYVPVNPWHYAISVLRRISGSMHTEEDIRLTIAERCPELAEVLAGISLQRCPGLVSRTFDEELAYQFKEDLYLQHCRERVTALAATTALGTMARAVDFCAQLFDQTTIQKLRKELGVSATSRPSPAVSVDKGTKKGSRNAKSKAAKSVPATGPIDAFLRTVKK